MDNPSRLTEAGVGALIAYGIKTVVDIRASFELGIDASPFVRSGPYADAVAYLCRPFFENEE